MPLAMILLVIVGGGLVLAVILGVQRSWEAAENVRRQAAFEAPYKHNTQVMLTIGDAVSEVLSPYCPDRRCPPARIREGAINAWEITATPAGLRLLVFAYLDPATQAPMARVKMDLATIREDGDLAKAFPPMVEIVNQVLQKLHFPESYRNAVCTGPATAGSSQFTCETGGYDPVFGVFDARTTSAAQLYKGRRTFSMLSRGPFRYDRSGDKILRSGP